MGGVAGTGVGIWSAGLGEGVAGDGVTGAEPPKFPISARMSSRIMRGVSCQPGTALGLTRLLSMKGKFGAALFGAALFGVVPYCLGAKI